MNLVALLHAEHLVLEIVDQTAIQHVVVDALKLVGHLVLKVVQADVLAVQAAQAHVVQVVLVTAMVHVVELVDQAVPLLAAARAQVDVVLLAVDPVDQTVLFHVDRDVLEDVDLVALLHVGLRVKEDVLVAVDHVHQIALQHVVEVVLELVEKLVGEHAHHHAIIAIAVLDV